MASRVATGRPRVEHPFSWRFTTPLYAGSALNAVNSSMIATALVPIAAGLHVSIGQTASLVTALYLASAIAQPTAGKLAEVFGARRVFAVGIVLVLLGGALGGIAPNLLTLLLARVLIGLGSSCAYPSAMVLVQRRAAAAGLEKPPGGVLGGLQIAGLATAALGLPIGGILVQTVGWRWVFFINIPVALLALTAALLWIPRDVAHAGPRSARELVSRIDLTGILGFAVAITALLGFLFSIPVPNWTLLVAALAVFAALVAWELRAKSPFIDVRLLARNGPLTRTYLRYALIALCVYIVLYGLTQWLEAPRGLSALSAGLLLLPTSVVSGLVVVPISRRNLVRGPVIVGGLASLLGAAGVLVLTSSTGIAVIVAITLLLGVASGLFRTFGYVGSIASSAITGVVFRAGVTDAGLHVIALIMIAVSLVAVALSVLDRTLRSPARATSTHEKKEPN